ncbi:MAG: hypothetical protein IPM64_04380 [Phycisphaerales bacterium]|nr:hypothetical protein [Phycisphaerales bacterium]
MSSPRGDAGSEQTAVRMVDRFRLDLLGRVRLCAFPPEPHSFVISSDGPARYLLQRIDHRSFPDAGALMSNVLRVSEHLRRRAAAEGAASPTHGAARPMQGVDESWFVHDPDRANAWRALEIPDAVEPLEVRDVGDAERYGAAIGAFHRRMAADFAWPPLIETAPGLHDTAAHLDALDRAARDDPFGRARAAPADIAAILRYPRYAAFLGEEQRRRVLPERVALNRCRPQSILCDVASGAPLCLWDLDRVMSATVLHDLGEMARLAVCSVAENEPNAGLVALLPERFESLLRGYFREAGALLTGVERERIVMAALGMTLERAARHMTAFLVTSAADGDPPAQHLFRARTQITLFLRMLAGRQALERVVIGVAG